MQTEPIIEEENKNENSNLNAVSIFEWVTPEKVAEEQQRDPTLELVYQLVTAGEKPKNISYSQNKIKSCVKIFTPQADYEKGSATSTIY